MSMCAGQTACEIYRDKKYCSKAKASNSQQCNCRHARLECEVTVCGFEGLCPKAKDEARTYRVLRERLQDAKKV